jgi:hypothetical protein
MNVRLSRFTIATLGLMSGAFLLTACSSEPKPEAPEATRVASIEEGVPGGVIVNTVTMTARVAAVDPATRKLTLVESDGKRTTITAGPEVINFDQIRVGDHLKATIRSELVVFMRERGALSRDGRAVAIAGAPRGAKPGVAMAESTEVTATLASIDQRAHRATLRFPDGRTTTVPVRSDVDLTKVSEGDQVVIRTNDTVAVVVETP